MRPVLTLLVAVLFQLALAPFSARGDDLEQSYAGILMRAGVATDEVSLTRAAEENSDSTIRSTALALLALRFGAAETMPVLLAALERDPAVDVQLAAGSALAEIGVEEGFRALTAVVDGADRIQDRAWAAWWLARNGRSYGYSTVAALAESDSENDRRQAAQIVASFVGLAVCVERAEQAPIALLLRLVTDASPWVRRSAVLRIPAAVLNGAPLEPLVVIVRDMAEHDEDSALRELARGRLPLLTREQLERERARGAGRRPER